MTDTPPHGPAPGTASPEAPPRAGAAAGRPSTGSRGRPGGEADPVAHALDGLDAALARLEGAVARRLDADADPDDRDLELALMDEDRARLAAALDAASARLAEVEATAGAVGLRIDRAIDTVAGVLGERGAPRP